MAIGAPSGPEVRGNFEPEMFFKDFFALRGQDEIKNYLEANFAPGGTPDIGNVEAMKGYLFELLKLLYGSPTPLLQKREEVIKQIAAFAGAGDYKIPSPEHRKELDYAWNTKLKHMFNQAGDLGLTLWTELGFEQIDFSGEVYQNLYKNPNIEGFNPPPVEEESVEEEQEEVPVGVGEMETHPPVPVAEPTPEPEPEPEVEVEAKPSEPLQEALAAIMEEGFYNAGQRKAMMKFLRSTNEAAILGMTKALRDKVGEPQKASDLSDVRKTPAEADLQKAILHVLGFASAPKPRVLLKRIRNLDGVINDALSQNGMGEKERKAGIALRKAIHKASLCLVDEKRLEAFRKLSLKENYVEAAEKDKKVAQWMSAFKARLKNATSNTGWIMTYMGLDGMSTEQAEAFMNVHKEEAGGDVSEEEEQRLWERMSAFKKAQELYKGMNEDFDSLPGTIGKAYVFLAGGEFAIRTGYTGLSTIAKATKSTALGLWRGVKRPFVQTARRASQAWNYVEKPKRDELPQDAGFMQRMGSSTWYTTKRMSKGMLAAGAALGLGLAGAAEGMAYAAPVAAGFEIGESASQTPPSKADIEKALKGKVSEEALPKILEGEDTGAMVERAVAELGENGIEHLTKAGVIVEDQSGFIRMSKDAGLLVATGQVLGGTKEAVIDNTWKAATIKGTRDFLTGSDFMGIKMPTANELLSYAAAVRKVSPSFKAKYDSSTSSTSVAKFFDALSQLSDEEQKEITRGLANTLDLKDDVNGFLKLVWTIGPEAFAMYSDLRNPERSSKTDYKTGIGVRMGQLTPEKLVAFANSETIDKLDEFHSIIMDLNKDSIKHLKREEPDREKARYLKRDLTNMQKAITNFLGVKRLRADSKDRYIGKLQPTIDLLEKWKREKKLVVGTGSSEKTITAEDINPDAKVLLNKLKYIVAVLSDTDKDSRGLTLVQRLESPDSVI